MHMLILKLVSLCRCCHGHVDERYVQLGDHRLRGQTDHVLEAPELSRVCVTHQQGETETPSAIYRTVRAKHPASDSDGLVLHAGEATA